MRAVKIIVVDNPTGEHEREARDELLIRKRENQSVQDIASLHLRILSGFWFLLNGRFSVLGRNAVSASKISSKTAAAIDARVVKTAANTQDTMT